MYDVAQARPVRREVACVNRTYTRDQLLSLYTPKPPIAAVTECLYTLNLYTVCRLHVQRRRHRQLYDHPVVGCYRGCRAGRTRRRPAIVRPTGCGAGILVRNSPGAMVIPLGPPSVPIFFGIFWYFGTCTKAVFNVSIQKVVHWCYGERFSQVRFIFAII